MVLFYILIFMVVVVPCNARCRGRQGGFIKSQEVDIWVSLCLQSIALIWQTRPCNARCFGVRVLRVIRVVQADASLLITTEGNGLHEEEPERVYGL